MKRKQLILLNKISSLTEDFFKKFGGKIVSTKIERTPSYSSHGNIVTCVNYSILFNNRNIFGTGDFSKDVYPRYRKMRRDWRTQITNEMGDFSKKILIGFIPLLSRHNIMGKGYAKGELKPLGTDVEIINKKSPSYLKKISKKFGSRFALKEHGGAYIGPEGAMLLTLEAIKKSSIKVSNFIDVAAGSGELSAYVLKNFKINNITVNDASRSISDHLKGYLDSIIARQKQQTNIKYVLHDCLSLEIPKHVDLISIGVFYGTQPTFVKKLGKKIASALGDGILLIQSSMPETLFNLYLIDKGPKDLENWPWFNKKFRISNYFRNHATIFVENEYITLASKSKNNLNKILLILVNGGARVLKKSF